MHTKTAEAPQHQAPKSAVARRVGVAALTVGIATTTGISAAGAQDLGYTIDQGTVDQYATQAYDLANEYIATGSSSAALQNLPIADYGTGFIQEAVAPAASVVKPAEGTFTSGFGPRWGSFHAGIDIANAVGTPIKAVMAGTVIDSGPASGYGQWIRIQHADGSVSVYGHMSSLYVGAGQYVAAGETIAGMGSEGFSTGSHLHFQIQPDGVTPVNPVPWLNERGVYL